jgi:two-component system, NtrC family, nitrogen regulation sensor histidine kinase NtrY
VRRRLLVAFLLVTFPPLLFLSLGATRLLANRLDETAWTQLDVGLRLLRARIDEEREKASAGVDSVVREGLRGAATPEPFPSEAAAARAGLDTLEILDREGKVLASRHWPAGFGLRDRDRLFGESAFRMETVADGYGAARKLTVVAERRGRARAGEVTVRGGRFLDSAFFADLSRLLSLEIGLRDEAGREWLAGTRTLASWESPGLDAERGRRPAGEALARWVATPLAPGLVLVVGARASALDGALGEIRRLTLWIVAAGFGLAFLAAVVFSHRLARPLQDLRDGARRVAEGDLAGSVSEAAPGELGDLARTFNAMTVELRSSRARLAQAERVAAWRAMAPRLAHELKKPLFPIQLSLETLRRALEKGSADPSFLRDTSDTVLGELRSLNRVIDAFTEVARLPAPRFAPTDLNEVVEHVLSLYSARAEGIRIEASTTEHPPVAGDADLLARALGNLVANALEAMPEGGTLRVRIRVVPDGVAVDVEDTGPGIREEDRARLLTPYFTTKPGGTGLGLAIVQGIVSDHGGRLDVGSPPGGGAVFTVVLPAVRS